MALNSLSTWLRTFADENLYRTLIGAAFGTFAGAWLTRRSQAKKELVTELNNIAAAIELAGAICNRYMALKRQHVGPMWEAITALRKKYEVRKKFGAGGTFHFTADLTRIMHDGENFGGDSGGKRPIHVANRCANELPRVSTLRHSDHDRRYAASVRSAGRPPQETHRRFRRRQSIFQWRCTVAAGGGA
jgi:hypothetical protein